MEPQFCTKCFATTRDYTTRYLSDGRRFHYCADVNGCAERRAKVEMGRRP